MYFRVASLVNLLCFFFIHRLIITSASRANMPKLYNCIGDVAINCGSTGNSTALDGRQWIGDTGSKDILFMQLKGRPRSSKTIDKSFHADPVPYMSSRISSAQFHYTFQVNPGQIFIRLHFYPSVYRGFERFYDFFSVKAGPFTLLTNFSASLATGALGVKYLVKEYLLNVEKDQALSVVFSPSKPGKSEKTYAFINGIEIISMPTGLYYTPDGDLGAHIVGQKNRIYIDDKSALETVERLNIGGYSISPAEDSCLYRRWSADAGYLMESEVSSINYGTRMIKIPSMPVFVAPLKIYQTSWSINSNKLADELYNFTWKIPVDVGFGYFIRLHFCELEPGVMKSGQRNFNILINNHLAESNADIIKWSGGYGIPVHRDYVMIVKGDKEVRKGILVIVVQAGIELIDGLLNGLEIMKLSNHDNNLASPGPELSIQASIFWASQVKALMLDYVCRNGIATCLTVVMVLLDIVVYYLRKFCEAKLPEVHFSIDQGGNSPKSTEKEGNSSEGKHKTPASAEQLCRHFSFEEMEYATGNFSDEFVIGKGGFGKVYKGFIDNGATIAAIKRLNSDSKQGAPEFWMEIETLSKLRHVHLVSLIGYCHDRGEMILVYEYMPGGTLADLLYGFHRSRDLSWEQRLRICIGAARGLDYLHTGTAPGIIHRDVKDSNILLDENFVAKVSDFGIAKLEKSSQFTSYITTNVKGTFGYLDPHYYLTRELSKKSDVYAFGVVMMVVLCGRPAVDRRVSEDQQGLVIWAQEQIKKGKVDQIIDRTLSDQISSSSLEAFVEIANKCFHEKQRQRPTMAQVVASLELSLQLQQQKHDPSESHDVEFVGDFSTLALVESLHSISEEMTDVGGPCPDETSTQDGKIDVSTSKGIVQKKEADNEVDSQRRKKDDTPNSKPARRWAWNMFWSPAKPKPSMSRSCIRFPISHVQRASHCVIYSDGVSTVYGSKWSTIKSFELKEKYDVEVVKKFCSEIEMLSQLQHPNLNSLIGYCYSPESQQIFLVYEYNSECSLADVLHGIGKNRTGYIPLTWEERLRICVGAARGLDYLHTSSVPGFIHRDVKDSNILLDKNLVAKVSHFEFADLDKWSRLNVYCTTAFIGALGYLDPGYVLTRKLTKQSDVYSFGVVLLVVLSGRPVTESHVMADQEDLVVWGQKCIRAGKVDQIIDPSLRGQISSASLNAFVELVEKCLHREQSERPTMAQVVAGLEFALQEK